MARRTHWIDTFQSAVVPDNTEAISELVGNNLAIDTMGFTLTRTIVRLDICQATVSIGAGMQEFSIGIGVASREAYGVGATALPDVHVDAEEPVAGWVFRWSGIIHLNNNDPKTVALDLDMRSQRKIDTGKAFLKMYSVTKDGTAGSVRITGLVRCLYLLP